MYKFKNYLKNFLLFWIIITISIGSYHYWKVNGRYYKPEWYQDYDILELDGRKYAIISYDKKDDKFLLVEAVIQNNELILNMEKRIFSNLTNIPINYKKFKAVKVIK